MVKNNQLLWLDSSDRDLWYRWLSQLPKIKRDIYYNLDYINLYARHEDIVNCYIFNRGNKVYLYPFIVRPVPEITGYFDITTAYGYGGPISNSDDPAFLEEAYARFIEETSKRNIVAEVIKFHPLLNNHLLLEEFYKGVITKICSTVYVDVNLDEQYRWEKDYTPANRNKIKKAKRYHVKIRLGNDDELWEEFKNLYENTMKANKARDFYFFPTNYFNSIKINLPNNYILISCTLKGNIITVMLVLLGTDYAHVHLIGSNNDFIRLGINNLLHHELIKWCKENGYSKLHIGGGRENNDDDSLLRFKKNFSDKMTSFYIGEHILNKKIYDELCQRSNKENAENTTDHLLKYRSIS